MKTTPSIDLSRYLSQKSRSDRPLNPTTFVTQGAELVSPNDLTGLHRLLPQVRKKSAEITDSTRLRRRLDLLVDYFQETKSLDATVERREIAFVLYYFLKGYDIIPDSIPQIGLLDDALLVETALNRNLATLRAHWAQGKRHFPEDL